MFQLKVVFQLKQHRLIADATNYAACCNRIAAGGVFNGCAVRQGEALTDSGSAALTTGKLPFQRRRGRLLSGQNIQQQLCRGAAGAAAAVAQGGDGNIRHRLGQATAVVCYNDEIAHLLIKRLLELGRAVPEEVAVVSFDNSFYSQVGPVPITSLGHRSGRTGRTAAKLLLDILAGKQTAPPPLEWELSRRQSG